ncbi:DUF1501 domain-containing protein [Noviherbaspirillum humi]|nr:DUF1501 domain-containing protein [Noviherbaspirillum humi]
MKRRGFLGAALAASGFLIPLGRDAWAVSHAGAPADAARRRLIVVMLRGAIDGLNVVAPYGDAEYARLRPTIGLDRPGGDNGVIDLDGYFGLHPALADLQPLWSEGKLAFVHACGSPDPTRSHFDAQDYLETGTPGRRSTPDGWLNRLVASLPGSSGPTRAIGIGPVMPRILSGSAPASTLALATGGRRDDRNARPALSSAFDQLYADDSRMSRAYRDAKQARQEVSAALDAEMQMANGGAPLPNGFPGDAARLAALMRNDPNMQIAFIALGGWDTHANQGAARGQLANRLAPLGRGLLALARGLGSSFDDTVIVVMSEFGRTARENGNGGTDHGHGNAMWLLGGRVNGGKVHADWPGLEGGRLHEGRDLVVSTDFRAVLSQVARQHLRLDDAALERLFPGAPAPGRAFRLLHA